MTCRPGLGHCSSASPVAATPCSTTSKGGRRRGRAEFGARTAVAAADGELRRQPGVVRLLIERDADAARRVDVRAVIKCSHQALMAPPSTGTTPHGPRRAEGGRRQAEGAAGEDGVNWAADGAACRDGVRSRRGVPCASEPCRRRWSATAAVLRTFASLRASTSGCSTPAAISSCSTPSPANAREPPPRSAADPPPAARANDRLHALHRRRCGDAAAVDLRRSRHHRRRALRRLGRGPGLERRARRRPRPAPAPREPRPPRRRSRRRPAPSPRRRPRPTAALASVYSSRRPPPPPPDSRA